MSNLEKFFYEEYNDYFKIINLCNEIEIMLSNSEPDVNVIVDKTCEVLYNMRCSSTMVYTTKKNLVDRVYKIVYDVMKVELLFSNNSRLFDIVMSDSTDGFNIIKFLKADLNHINDVYITNKDMSLEYNVDFKSSYLDNADLIRIVAILNDPKLCKALKKILKKNKDKIEDFSEKISKQKKINDSLEEKLNYCEYEYQRSKQEARFARLKISFLAVLMAATMPVGFKVADKFGWSDTYNITTTTYDSDTGKSSTDVERDEWDYSDVDRHVIITKYTPWQGSRLFRDDTAEDAYSRDVYTYELSPELAALYFDYDDPSVYLTSDLRDKINVEKHEVEKSSELPDDYGYGDSKYTVVQSIVDFDSLEKQRDLASFAIIFSPFFSLFRLQLLIYTDYKKGKFKNSQEVYNKSVIDLWDILLKCEIGDTKLKKLDTERDALNKLNERQSKLIKSLSLVKKKK